MEDPRWLEDGAEARIEQALRMALAHLGVAEDELAVLLTDDGQIARLNAGFRGKAAPTNVLSWPAEERAAPADGARPDLPEPGTGLGDIALAYETCAAEAAAQGKTFAAHVTHLAVHGLLHCLGYDHERDGDATLMEKTEVEILGILGLPDPYSTHEGAGPAAPGPTDDG